MKSISSSQCLISVYEAWSCLGDITISLPFNTQQITITNFVFGYSGWLLLMFWCKNFPKSVTGCFSPHGFIFLDSRISYTLFFKIIPIHCRQIHSTLSKFSNGRQFTNVVKKSSTTVSLCRGPSQSGFKHFCCQIMHRCFFSRNPVTHSFFRLLNAL